MITVEMLVEFLRRHIIFSVGIGQSGVVVFGDGEFACFKNMFGRMDNRMFGITGVRVHTETHDLIALFAADRTNYFEQKVDQLHAPKIGQRFRQPIEELR